MREEKIAKILGNIDEKYTDEAAEFACKKQASDDAPETRRGVGKRTLFMNPGLIAAAAVILVVVAFSVVRNFSAEAKEYAEAVEYFKTNGMSTEGLSRTEIKETYRREKKIEDFNVAVSREEYIKYMEQLVSTPDYQNYINFVRRWEPDFDPLNIPVYPGETEYIISTAPYEWMRDYYFSKCFSGDYITDANAKLEKVPYYSFEQLLFNKRNDTFRLGRDSSEEEYGNKSSHISSLLKECPTEVMRERQDGSRYLVYDTDDNCRLFLMLSNNKVFPLPLNVGFPVIYKNKLSYSDFKDIKPGDTIAKVSEIDDICELYTRTWFDFCHISSESFKIHGEKMQCFSTIHYLTDGLLRIEYGELNEEGVPVVKSVTLYPDYIMETYTGKMLDYTINPLDLPE